MLLWASSLVAPAVFCVVSLPRFWWKVKLSLPDPPNDADASVGDAVGAGDVADDDAISLVGTACTIECATSLPAMPDPLTIVEFVTCSLSSTGVLGATAAFGDILLVSTFRSDDNRVWVKPPFASFVSAPATASLELLAAP